MMRSDSTSKKLWKGQRNDRWCQNLPLWRRRVKEAERATGDRTARGLERIRGEGCMSPAQGAAADRLLQSLALTDFEALRPQLRRVRLGVGDPTSATRRRSRFPAIAAAAGVRLRARRSASGLAPAADLRLVRERRPSHAAQERGAGYAILSFAS